MLAEVQNYSQLSHTFSRSINKMAGAYRQKENSGQFVAFIALARFMLKLKRIS
jgi:hypothetical protein